jgi:sulfhydrogenase subunit gamma (sulfur reductase)
MLPLLMADSIYIPVPARVAAIKTLTARDRLLTLELPAGQSLDYQPGQFIEVSVLGVGEAPFAISSSLGHGMRTARKFEVCIRKVGDVATALHNLSEGATVGVRGPFGKGFPIEKMHGKDILFAPQGPGLGCARSLINRVLDERALFGRVMILYDAERPSELLFKDELDVWNRHSDIEFFVTVNRHYETWTGRVGAITTLFHDITVNPRNTVAITIGRPMTYRLVLMELLGKGIPEGQIWLSLECRIRCGVGKCGHCQIGHLHCCLQGPYFSYAQIKDLEDAI